MCRKKTEPRVRWSAPVMVLGICGLGCRGPLEPVVPARPPPIAEQVQRHVGEVDLQHFDATLRVHPSTPTGKLRIEGTVQVSAVSHGATSLSLDAVDFEHLNAASTPDAQWAYDGERLKGQWAQPVEGTITIDISYGVSPSQGLQQGDEAVWSAFHTWHWMPVSHDPSERATLSLHVAAPAGWTVLATGDGPAAPGPDVVSEVPHPSYTYGFFAGKLSGPQTEGPFDVWGAPPETATIVIDRSAGALARWTGQFGAPWLLSHYVQVFVPGRAAQELAGMAFLSRSYLDVLTKDPTEDWLIVHELAHQAWGNHVTCASWGDFWLNEAIVVWWVGRDKELRGDRAALEHERELWAQRAKRALADKGDVRIARPGVDVSGAGGSLVYHAGALLVDELSTAVGVERFEVALGKWIQRGRARGTSVSTDAFVAALPLTDAQRAAVQCRLADASAPCPALDPR